MAYGEWSPACLNRFVFLLIVRPRLENQWQSGLIEMVSWA
jgi:hypothetical protein